MVGSSRNKVSVFRGLMQTPPCYLFVSGLCLRRADEAMGTWHQSCECLRVFISQDNCHFYLFGGSPLNLFCVHSFVQGQEESNGSFQNQGEGESASSDHDHLFSSLSSYAYDTFWIMMAAHWALLLWGTTLQDGILEIIPRSRPGPPEGPWVVGRAETWAGALSTIYP